MIGMMAMDILYLFIAVCVSVPCFGNPAAQYSWNCTTPNNDGRKFIPGIRDLSGIMHNATLDGNILNIYSVPNLNTDCYGEVIGMEYCYCYEDTGGQEAIHFNWTLLVLSESSTMQQGRSVFTVIDSYSIENHDPRECAGVGCGVGKKTCCARSDMINFDLPRENFVFAVTESTIGNTHQAALQRPHGSGGSLSVCTITRKVPTTGTPLSRDSSFELDKNAVTLGLPYLWFVVESDIDSIMTTNARHQSTYGFTTTSSRQGSTDESMTTNARRQSTDEIYLTTVPPTDLQSAISNNIVAPAIGGAVGGLIVVIAVIAVVLIALLFIKRSQKGSLKVNDRKESVLGFNNAVYDGANTSDTKIQLDISNKSASFSKASYEYITEQTQRKELGHDYSLPSEIHNEKLQPKHPTQESPPAVPEYATAAYEIPANTFPYEAALSQTKTSADYNEDIYMVPASNEDALYSQLSQIRIHNFTRDSIRIIKLLGAGQFGKVHQGEWIAPGSKDTIDVAVKTLQEGTSEEDKVKFLQEAAIMGQFSHPNVVKLYGVVTEGEPVMLVIELLPKGDLREVLCSVCSESSSEVKIDADLPHTLLSYCRQVASGMSYLAGKLFVHRDLAARNILVSEDGACKIADFGMSRDLADTNYYVSHGGKIPVKWTAPEALHYKKYSTASDVWSFGCVIYEIWSLGHKPFEQYSNQDSIKLIDNGVRLPPPPGCPRTIYKLMIDCWHPESSSRPDFVSVVQQLSLPDTKLLKWSEEDKATDPEAATLGAGLDKAVDLYKDLQKIYVTN